MGHCRPLLGVHFSGEVRSDVYGEIEEFSLMLKSTSKSREFLREHEVTLRAAIEMAD
jgi:hypothetical protein